MLCFIPFSSEENDNRGLKAMSEENLEALHKIVRRIRERKARLINVGMNLTDILTRWVFGHRRLSISSLGPPHQYYCCM